MLSKEQTKGKNIGLLIFSYWSILIIWQTISMSSNRGTLDILVKFTLFSMLFFYAIFNTGNLKISSTKVLLLIAYAFFQVITFGLTENVFSITSLVTPIFSIGFVFIFFIILDKQELPTVELLKFLNYFIFSVTIMSLYNSVVLWPIFSNVFKISNAYGNEMSSFLISNHEFALYLILGTISCLIHINKKTNRNNIYIFCIFFFLINLITTFSRTSFLALFLCITTIVILLKNKYLFKYVLLLISLMLLIKNNPNINNYIINIVFKKNNLAGRDVLIGYGISLFKDQSLLNKLLGIGFKNTSLNAMIATGNLSFHNGYLTLLLNGGIIMFLFFLIIIIYSFSEALKCMKYDLFFGSVYCSLLILALSIMITNTTIPFFSSITSFTLTVFCFVIPKYHFNHLKSK